MVYFTWAMNRCVLRYFWRTFGQHSVACRWWWLPGCVIMSEYQTVKWGRKLYRFYISFSHRQQQQQQTLHYTTTLNGQHEVLYFWHALTSYIVQFRWLIGYKAKLRKHGGRFWMTTLLWELSYSVLKSWVRNHWAMITCVTISWLQGHNTGARFSKDHKIYHIIIIRLS